MNRLLLEWWFVFGSVPALKGAMLFDRFLVSTARSVSFLRRFLDQGGGRFLIGSWARKEAFFYRFLAPVVSSRKL